MRLAIRRAAVGLAVAGAVAIPATAQTTEVTANQETTTSSWEFIATFPTYQQCVDTGAWYAWTQWYCAQNGRNYDLYALY